MVWTSGVVEVPAVVVVVAVFADESVLKALGLADPTPICPNEIFPVTWPFAA